MDINNTNHEGNAKPQWHNLVGWILSELENSKCYQWYAERGNTYIVMVNENIITITENTIDAPLSKI